MTFFSYLIIKILLETYKTGFLENIAQLHKIIFVSVAFLYSISVCLGTSHNYTKLYSYLLRFFIQKCMFRSDRVKTR